MKRSEIREIVACLPRGRTLFYYYKDRYAPLLLSHLVGNGLAIAELRRSRFARLLDKAPVKQALAWCGGGELRKDALLACGSPEAQPFVLTLGAWGGTERSWDQTSRPGHNLVLQLNFSKKHEASYRQLVKPRSRYVFNTSCHPIMRQRRNGFVRDTLAWARIDLDFDSGEVLIEEIQSDWMREVAEARRDLHRHGCHGLWSAAGSDDDIAHYLSSVMEPYARLWDEAMLAAAVQFVRQELGLRKIYYHDYATGIRLKALHRSYGHPPRSLYTKLPRRFCFEHTDQVPEFLRRDKLARRVLKKVASPRFYQLEL